MPTAEVNGIKLYYEDYGSGYPVVFLHGFAGTTQAWKPQVPAFSKHYRFIIYDARGHGQSQSPPSHDQYSADIVADDLHQLLRVLNIPEAVLGGLSTGGYQCLRFHLRHPEMVSALILMGTGPGYRNLSHMAKWNQLPIAQAKLLETKGIVAFAEEPNTQTMMSYTPAELMLKQNPIGLANMARKVVAQHDSQVIKHLGEIKVPTLVVVGEYDTLFLAAADYMLKTIPKARRVTIPQAGHAVNLDNTEIFNQAILNFLDELHLK